MKRIFIIIFVAALAFPIYGKVDVMSLVVEHLDLKDGLSSNFVTDICQDKRGFLWVATEAGLSRFDGDNFKVFNENNTTLSGNSINALLYDEKNDELWIGTKKGLSRFDCATQKFKEVKIPEGLNPLNIMGLSRSSDGGIWILNHYDYILHYDTAQDKMKVYTKKEIPGLPYVMYCIADDGKGNLYIGHEDYGLSVVNTKTMRVENYRHQPGNIASLPGNDVYSMLIDRLGNIWVGTDSGLALFNPMTKGFSSFNPGNGYPVVAGNINSIRETVDGMLWIGSDIGGVCMLDIRNLTFLNPDKLQFFSIPVATGNFGISSVNVTDIFQDSFGNIWIGNHSDGLDFISRMQPVFKNISYYDVQTPTKGKPVWSLYVERNGNVWLGSDNEMALSKNGKILKTYNLRPYITRDNGRVSAITKSGDNLLLGVYENGLLKLNVNTGKVTRLKMSEDSNNYASSFYNLSNGKVLFGTQDGLYEYDSDNINKLKDISSAISSLVPHGIAEDRQGKLWIGTYGNGVFIFDKNRKLTHHLESGKGFVSNAVKHMYLDSRGWMWIAGQDGLSLIKDTSHPDHFQNFDYNSGLNDIHIRALTEDNSGNIWFSTNNNLTMWNKNSGKLESYDYHNGLSYSGFTDRSVGCTADGCLYFGTLKGACFFNPKYLPKDKKQIPVRIVECQNAVTNNEIDKISDSKGESIEMPYDLNSIRILFSVPDFSQSQLVEYSYMVDGLDKVTGEDGDGWMSAGREHSATLHNLPPGKYVFKVRARLRNQDWSNENVATIGIIITPPIWLTWYAKLLYVIIFICALYTVMRFYKHRLQLENSIVLERKKGVDERALNDERLRFYTNITHELRTPLTLILGPLEDLVSDKKLPDDYRHRIKTIHASAMRLLSLINQILEFRKTETQNRKLTVSKGDISKEVMEVGLRFKELNRNEKVTINLDVDNDIGELYFDKEILQTILNNLLSNAIKYTPEGEIRLSLHKISESGGNFVEISVSDTGYGIDDKALPHIFDRYYQAKGKYQASGTGIGLALVKALADLHEGTLSVTSEVGKGTIFEFRINADNQYPNALHKETVTEPTAEETKIVEEMPADKRQVVLVVEDNADIREYIESSLNATYNVVTAADGMAGVEIARNKIPDIIVSDVMMPVMDGMELCKNVKEDIRTSHIPVILLTAKDSLQDKEAGYEIGADSYLTKPFSAKLLLSRIQNILESRKRLASIISSSIKNDSAGTVVNAPQEQTPTPLRLSKLDEEFIQKFTRIVEENITMDNLDMTYIQRALNMSHSTLYRKTKGLTGMSGNEFIRKIRMKKAHELLNDGCNVSEAAYSCGFNDVGYFRNCFKEEYGMSPSAFIKQLTNK